jgi:hypothetical protein
MSVELNAFLQQDPNNAKADYVRQTIAELPGESH